MPRLSPDIRAGLRDYTAVIAAQIGVLPISLLWLAAIARALGPHAFGAYLVGIALVQFLFRFLIGWASSTVIRFGTAEALQSQRLNRTVGARLVLLVLGSAIGVTLLEIGQPLLRQWTTLSSAAIHWLGVVLLTSAWWDVGLSVSRTLGAIGRFALGSWLRQVVLLLGGGCIWAGLLPKSVESVLAVEASAYALVGSGLMLRAGLGLLVPVRLERASVIQFIRYAWSNVVAFLAGYLVDWIDLYVIRYFLGLSAVGVYQLGYRFMSLASNGLMGITVVTFPLFMRWKAEGRPETMKRFLEETTPTVSWLWAAAMAVLISLTPELIKGFGGPDYQPAAPCLAILWAGLAFQAIPVMMTSLFSVHDALPTIMVLNLAAAGINMAGDLVAVPRWGIVGAAWATAVSFTVTGLASGWLAHRRFGVRLGSAWFFPWFGWLVWGLCRIQDALWIRIIIAAGVVGMGTLVARMRTLAQSSKTQAAAAMAGPGNAVL
jgi:O-antigen/teichoic acid export membrane protein